MSRRTLTGRIVAAAVAVTAAAWIALDAPESPPAAAAATPAPAKAQLTSFPSCVRFLSHMRREARALVGPYGIAGYAGGSPLVDVLPAAASGGGVPEAAADARASNPAPVAGVDFSDTNVQEAGVDEPDIVETDGRRIFSIVGTEVHVVEAAGAASRRLGSISLEGMFPTGMFLQGDRLFVLGDEPGGPIGIPEPLPGPADSDAARSSVIFPVGSNSVLVQVDVSDPAAMRETARLEVEGRLLAARLVGTTARLVVASEPSHIATAAPRAAGVAAERRATRLNRAAIARSRPADWLPSFSVRRAGAKQARERVAVACDDVARTDRFAGLGMTSVLTVDLSAAPRLIDGDAVMTDGGLVYASAGNLYVASPRWSAPDAAADAAPGRVSTHIHRFDISDPAATTYEGSGAVPGYVLNQFAMSEHEGHLRVASTDDPPFSDAGEPAGESESFVSVLRAGGGTLPTAGRVGGLGRGERIFSVRFIGARGYVVTFRQTDPLYTLDLADPARPAVRGELKIPGFSTYLHPVGENRLVGIGQDANAAGRATGLQASLFDVSDPTRPRRLAQQRLGERFSSSEAEYDHHAVLYWAPTGLLLLPFQSYGDTPADSSAGAVGIKVTNAGPGGALSQIARIAHPRRDGEEFEPPVRRGLVAGDTVYTVSDAGVRASDLTTLADRVYVPFAR